MPQASESRRRWRRADAGITRWSSDGDDRFVTGRWERARPASGRDLAAPEGARGPLGRVTGDVAGRVAPPVEQDHAGGVTQGAASQVAVREDRVARAKSLEDDASRRGPPEAPARLGNRTREDPLHVPQAVGEAVADTPGRCRSIDPLPVQRAGAQQAPDVFDPVQGRRLEMVGQMDRQVEEQVIVRQPAVGALLDDAWDGVAEQEG